MKSISKLAFLTATWMLLSLSIAYFFYIDTPSLLAIQAYFLLAILLPGFLITSVIRKDGWHHSADLSLAVLSGLCLVIASHAARIATGYTFSTYLFLLPYALLLRHKTCCYIKDISASLNSYVEEFSYWQIALITLLSTIYIFSGVANTPGIGPIDFNNHFTFHASLTYSALDTFPPRLESLSGQGDVLGYGYIFHLLNAHIAGILRLPVHLLISQYIYFALVPLLVASWMGIFRGTSTRKAYSLYGLALLLFGSEYWIGVCSSLTLYPTQLIGYTIYFFSIPLLTLPEKPNRSILYFTYLLIPFLITATRLPTAFLFCINIAIYVLIFDSGSVTSKLIKLSAAATSALAAFYIFFMKYATVTSSIFDELSRQPYTLFYILTTNSSINSLYNKLMLASHQFSISPLLTGTAISLLFTLLAPIAFVLFASVFIPFIPWARDYARLGDNKTFTFLYTSCISFFALCPFILTVRLSNLADIAFKTMLFLFVISLQHNNMLESITSSYKTYKTPTRQKTLRTVPAGLFAALLLLIPFHAALFTTPAGDWKSPPYSQLNFFLSSSRAYTYLENHHPALFKSVRSLIDKSNMINLRPELYQCYDYILHNTGGDITVVSPSLIDTGTYDVSAFTQRKAYVQQGNYQPTAQDEYRKRRALMAEILDNNTIHGSLLDNKHVFILPTSVFSRLSSHYNFTTLFRNSGYAVCTISL